MTFQKICKELIIILLTALPIIYLLVNWSVLPDRLPVHFDGNGETNGYGSKLVFIFLPLGLYLLLIVVPFIDPRKSNYLLFSSTYFKIRVILSAFLGLLNTVVIYNELHGISKIGSFVPISVFILFTLLGIYMGNISPNYFVGIKVPWTLNNDEVWIRTHKLAGKLWFWGCILGIVSLFFVKNAALVMFPVIIVITVVPIVYSYIIYQKIANQL